MPLSVKRPRGRPRKNAQIPAPAPKVVSATPQSAARLSIEDARLAVYSEASAHAREAIALFVEAIAFDRAGMAAGRPPTRQGIEAGKVILGILDRPGESQADSDMSQWTIEQLQAFVAREDEKRANAAKDMTPDAQAIEMLS